MAKRPYVRRRAILVHPPSIRPEDLATFVQLGPFERAWEELELTDEDLRALEMLIMAAPRGSPVVPGTGGLRKMRFSGGGWQGKRGGVRVCYAHYPEHAVVLLVIAYAKSRKDDLNHEERSAIRAELERFGRLLAEGRRKVGRLHGSE